MILISGGVVTTISFLHLYVCNMNLDTTKQKLLAPPIAATTPQDCRRFNLPKILYSAIQRGDSSILSKNMPKSIYLYSDFLCKR